jgi:hypothetical protein
MPRKDIMREFVTSASTHMTRRKDWFGKFEPYIYGDTKFEDDMTIEIFGKGDVSMLLHIEEPHDIQEGFYMFGLKKNILFINQFSKMNLKDACEDAMCTIKEFKEGYALMG